MTRSFGPRKTASKLSESVHQQLSMYGLAASAAGVSLLALAQPSEAKIIYTPAHVVIGPGGQPSYNLDLNHDGVTDFIILVTGHRINCTYNNHGIEIDILESAVAENGVAGSPAPLALHPGSAIGTKHEGFGGGAGLMAFVRTGNLFCWGEGGNWLNVTRRYLGLKFYHRGKAHYGWARLNVSGSFFENPKATLTGYAYETIPGKSIIAGQTREADDFTVNLDSSNRDDVGPGTSLTRPIPDVPQPASLGMLALGAQGVPLWRRKGSALAGDLKGALL